MDVTKILLYIMIIAIIIGALAILYGTYTILLALNVPDWGIVGTISMFVVVIIGAFASCIPGDANMF